MNGSIQIMTAYGTWDEGLEWVRHVWSGKTLASSELERWLAAIGTGISEVWLYVRDARQS